MPNERHETFAEPKSSRCDTMHSRPSLLKILVAVSEENLYEPGRNFQCLYECVCVCVVTQTVSTKLQLRGGGYLGEDTVPSPSDSLGQGFVVTGTQAVGLPHQQI